MTAIVTLSQLLSSLKSPFIQFLTKNYGDEEWGNKISDKEHKNYYVFSHFTQMINYIINLINRIYYSKGVEITILLYFKNIKYLLEWIITQNNIFFAYSFYTKILK